MNGQIAELSYPKRGNFFRVCQTGSGTGGTAGGNIQEKSWAEQEFSVSTQHYSFAVNAFVELIERYGSEKYDFCLRETQTYEIIEDVAQMKSEIGILYLNDFNRTVLEKLIKEHDLVFTELFVAKPHIFVSTKNPLAGKKSVTIEELGHILIFLLNRENTILFISPRRYSVPWTGRKTSVSETGQPCLIC